MKRSTKHLSDVDMRGRVRRGPREEPIALVPAKFLDGPAAGQTLLAPRNADYIKIGSWTYSYAGKDGKMRTYCKLPKSRRDRNFLMVVIGKRGADPRAAMAQVRRSPIRSDATLPPKHGRGARRRALRRAEKAHEGT